MFRNIATSDWSEWTELPGPAEWWPDDYDYEAHGFDYKFWLSKGSHAAALDLLFDPGVQVHPLYASILQSNCELQTMLE